MCVCVCVCGWCLRQSSSVAAFAPIMNSLSLSLLPSVSCVCVRRRLTSSSSLSGRPLSGCVHLSKVPFSFALDMRARNAQALSLSFRRNQVMNCARLVRCTQGICPSVMVGTCFCCVLGSAAGPTSGRPIAISHSLRSAGGAPASSCTSTFPHKLKFPLSDPSWLR